MNVFVFARCGGNNWYVSSIQKPAACNSCDFPYLIYEHIQGTGLD